MAISRHQPLFSEVAYYNLKFNLPYKRYSCLLIRRKDINNLLTIELYE